MLRALKGNIIYSGADHSLVCQNNAYLLAEDGVVLGVFPVLPEEYAAAGLTDYGDALIIPGLVDTHFHAPQAAFAGLGMDMPLLEWLQAYAFPEEGRYGDLDYAALAYGRVIRQLRRGFTTRCAVYASAYTESSLLLADLLHQAGLGAYVGRVSMDCLAPDGLREGDSAAADEADFVKALLDRGYALVKPIVTPRFVPSCSSRLLEELGRLAQDYQLPVQSHLAENREEIEMVRQLYPDAPNYTSVYHRFGLLGQTPTIMAHCVYCGEAERALLKEQGVYIAYCPQSNTNIMSGAAPARAYLEEGQRLCLGSDVAGGAHLSMFRVMQDAVAVSKLRCCLLDPSQPPLNLAEAFYLATRGGGAFFGQVGAFEPGYSLDALVIDDKATHTDDFTLAERLSRVIYLLAEDCLLAKYVNGAELLGSL